ncbi:cysteine--tRNA ligase [Trichophyton mentagrophytes]|uniref:tRNA synthetases class I catalytic domain-containing protein n=1 Tax=Trichophyton interdigitale (strain MR816) TaxID=1215338 RepID=A0A059J4V1_TRIIM|nr:hypothetical protein H101_03892 [Trichophyton interdigitale H6]KAG5209851.1 Cysteine--tRNA ligase [Trichophyton interdigitale]KAG5218638.1 Cysteine--tRNA ligase [Trichophyton interdigitale]KDB22517.1 hypothetical protein H109_05551 [Trichophyton interdigitale MR816]GBF62517.1 cysteine--tRNA ligase [Trichophyton mentagrophytes]
MALPMADQQPRRLEPLAHPECTLPPLRIWSSLTRSETAFIPVDYEGKSVTWHTCGPTVYDNAQLGHARNYVITDIPPRIMRDYFKFNVKFIMNIADVDDKVISRVRQQHLFAEYKIKYPFIDTKVFDMAQLAFSTFLEQRLPLLGSGTLSSNFYHEAKCKYGYLLSGGILNANKKPGLDEARIKGISRPSQSLRKL